MSKTCTSLASRGGRRKTRRARRRRRGRRRRTRARRGRKRTRRRRGAGAWVTGLLTDAAGNAGKTYQGQKCETKAFEWAGGCPQGHQAVAAGTAVQNNMGTISYLDGGCYRNLTNPNGVDAGGVPDYQMCVPCAANEQIRHAMIKAIAPTRAPATDKPDANWVSRNMSQC